MDAISRALSTFTDTSLETPAALIVIPDNTSAIFIEENVAMWIGWVTLVNNNGDEVKVDKSWGYSKDDKGRLKIVLLHSSLPYEA